VVGPPRSGNRLTGRILARHSRIFVPPVERSFFEHIATPPRRGAGPPDYVRLIERHWIAGNRSPEHRRLVAEALADPDTQQRLQRAAGPAEALDAVMRAQARMQGRARWCSQTHNDLFHLPAIFRCYPRATVVICIRHPLDFMVSYRDKWQRTLRRDRPEAARRIRHLYHPVITAIFWRLNVRAIERALARWPESVLLLRYEDLVTDPDGTIRRLCDFLGERFEAGMLRPGYNNSSLDGQPDEIFTSSLGRWKRAMAPAEAFVAQLICRRAMRGFGYPLAELGRPVGGALRHVASAPACMLKALPHTARGALLPYLCRRLGLPLPRPGRKAPRRP
jgi:hypothetical protein